MTKARALADVRRVVKRTDWGKARCSSGWPLYSKGGQPGRRRWSWGLFIPYRLLLDKSVSVDRSLVFPYRASVGTREKILETAGQLFATHGYADTSLAQVARAAQVSKALVLWYFESKEHLFRTALQHFLAPYAIDDQRLLGLNAWEQLEKLIDDYSDFIAEHLHSVKFVLSQVVREDETSKDLVARVRELYRVYRGQLTAIIEQGRAAGVFTPQMHPVEDATLILATLNGLFVQNLVEHLAANQMQDLLTCLKRTLRARFALPGLCEQTPGPFLSKRAYEKLGVSQKIPDREV